MIKDTSYYSQLLKRFIHDECSREEAEEVMDYLQSNQSMRTLLQQMQEEYEAIPAMPAVPAGKWSDRVRQVLQETAQPESTTKRLPVHRVHFLKTSWFRYAAAVILIIGAAAIWYTLNTPARHFERSASGVRNLAADIQPGGNKAILTLADGSTIVLDNAQNGSLAQQGATNIIKLDNGQLAYRHATVLNRGMPNPGELLYNTIATPRGGQYQVVLPDGSKVWLNAASSIKFPAAFTNSTREVEVTGEAYLEIAQNAKQPFYVHTNKTTVQVLGTSFNINAYDDEPAEKTTLIEGSVRVGGIVLKPGEQAQIKDQSNPLITKITVQDVISWKNGAFNFEGASLEEAMKQLARWYDLEVVYEKGIPNVRLGGEISRDLSLESLLKALKETDIHYRIEDNRRLIILP